MNWYIDKTILLVFINVYVYKYDNCILSLAFIDILVITFILFTLRKQKDKIDQEYFCDHPLTFVHIMDQVEVTVAAGHSLIIQVECTHCVHYSRISIFLDLGKRHYTYEYLYLLLFISFYLYLFSYYYSFIFYTNVYL